MAAGRLQRPGIPAFDPSRLWGWSGPAGQRDPGPLGAGSPCRRESDPEGYRPAGKCCSEGCGMVFLRLYCRRWLRGGSGHGHQRGDGRHYGKDGEWGTNSQLPCDSPSGSYRNARLGRSGALRPMGDIQPRSNPSCGTRVVFCLGISPAEGNHLLWRPALVLLQ